MDLGERFARALATKDAAGLHDVLDPAVDFRGLTPRRAWEATSADELVDGVLLGQWFEPGDVVREVEEVTAGSVADCERVSYRFRVTSGGEEFVVEQQGYYVADAGRITWLRMLCSGFRRIEEAS